MLTPSSNTALEPIVQAMVAASPEVSVHFNRFRVTEISLSKVALAQFDHAAMVHAARLLADAKVSAIAWNGTSSSWLGFEEDRELCRLIEAATGIKATTSILALNEVLQRKQVKRLGLVTPYVEEVQAKIISNYAGIGVACSSEWHFGLKDNYSFAEIDAGRIFEAAIKVAREGVDAIAIICTNLKSASLVERLEKELAVPVYDTIATAVWKTLCLSGCDPSRVSRWGSLFTEPR